MASQCGTRENNGAVIVPFPVSTVFQHQHREVVVPGDAAADAGSHE